MNEIPFRSLATAATSLRLSDEFDIRSIEQVLGGKDVVQALHRHDHYFLLVLTTGEGLHECDFRPHTLAPHTIYSMRPGQVHRLELKVGSTGYILQFKADFLATAEQGARLVLRRAGHIEVFHTDPKRYDALLFLLDRIARAYASRQEGHLHIARAYLGAFLADLVLHAPAMVPVSEAKGYTQERLEELLELIETHVYDTKEVGAYAKLMHLSTFQLNAIAKAGTGRTCSELITDQIILEAKRYLLATTEQVAQVADRLGYDDPSYFIRFFKKHTGHTPEGFRQKSR
ncbi:MAG TPA: helix-turn-helix transcriptional regulator [Flavobacteriales bacterium]|nr:helix-turn-helix transcriptional regulator [Flavobacteriales bacterium]HMR27287.1 helix-turn-helix transcriptional regulator [Flavobacteriales bacterium]